MDTQVKQFEFRYKGDRGYIHGTDILNQTTEWLASIRPDISDIDIAFHKLAVRQLRGIATIPGDGVDPVAVCSYTTGGERARVSLLEIDQAVLGRYPYQEDDIVKEMKIDLTKRQGVLNGDTHYSDIEVFVAMTKTLHYKVFQQLPGKWLFVRGRFPWALKNSMANERTITIAASFNDKLTRSAAMMDGVKVGEIYFLIV
jgi:hypothetical protein